jgi:microcystin-dependent protein
MFEPFIGTIMYFTFDYEPQGWVFCDGREVPTNHPKYKSLFSLIQYTYSPGSGGSTFFLPDLRGRTMTGQDPAIPAYNVGKKSGDIKAKLELAHLPKHGHTVPDVQLPVNSGRGSFPDAGRNYPAQPEADGKMYGDSAQDGAYMPVDATIDTKGTGATFSTDCPFIALNCCIAVVGIMPSKQ